MLAAIEYHQMAYDFQGGGLMFSLLLVMSVLQPIWDQTELADTAKVRGWRRRHEVEESNRSRSPRRRQAGVKAMLTSWAKGESSAAGVWRLCHAIVKEDGTDAGLGVHRLANIASASSGSEKLRQSIKQTTG